MKKIIIENCHKCPYQTGILTIRTCTIVDKKLSTVDCIEFPDFCPLDDDYVAEAVGLLKRLAEGSSFNQMQQRLIEDARGLLARIEKGGKMSHTSGPKIKCLACNNEIHPETVEISGGYCDNCLERHSLEYLVEQNNAEITRLKQQNAALLSALKAILYEKGAA